MGAVAKNLTLFDFIDNTTDITNNNSDPIMNINSFDEIELPQTSEEGTSLLKKFDELEIEQENRISPEDKKVCEDLQTNFDEAVTFLLKQKEFLEKNAVANKFINSETFLKTVQEKLKDITQIFIYNIFSYFQDNYNITLSSYKIEMKYDHTIRYETLIDEIYEQLDGLSFYEKASNEIKEKLKEAVRYRDITVKGKKLSINNFLYIEEGWGKEECRISYYREGYMNALILALMHFESGITKLGHHYNTFKVILEGRSVPRNKLICKHEYDDWFDKFKAIRIFLNGKVEIYFDSNELAQQFAKEYCGWKPKE